MKERKMKRAVFLLALAMLLVSVTSLRSDVQARVEELAQVSELAAPVSLAQPAAASVAVPVAPLTLAKVAPVRAAGGGGVTPTPQIQPVAGGPTPVPAAPVPCPCCGIIWHADNQEFGETYGESPIGGLSEACWIVGQTWTEQVFDDKVVPERWTFAIRPGTVVWIRGHRGGTAWLFAGDEAAVRENIQLQAEQLRIRDGEMQTGIVVLPDQVSAFRLVVRVRTADNPSTSGGNPGSSNPGTATFSSVVAVSQTAGQRLPTVNGPAIVDTMTKDGKALVVKVNRGKSFLLENPGTPFPFSSQAALDSRWPAHKAEFHRKHPDGQELEI
jgi:hypothetical protein